MKIGIIGSGNIGGNLGLHLAQAGNEVFFSSRHPEELQDLVQQAGEHARAGTVQEAAQFGELIVLATPFGKIPEVAQEAGPLAGKIIIDTTNPYENRDGEIAAKVNQNPDLRASEYTAQHFPEAHVVKAFNTIYYVNLRDKAFQPEGYRMAVPYAGDDAQAKKVVAQLLEDMGFDGVDIGSLSQSDVMEPDGILYTRVLQTEEIKRLLEEERE